MTTRNVQHLNR